MYGGLPAGAYGISHAMTNPRGPRVRSAPSAATIGVNYLEKIGNSFSGTFNYTHLS